jgi:hypothetical protein
VALRTASVETPVEAIGNRLGSILPSVVMPLNGSASPCVADAIDSCSCVSGLRFGGAGRDCDDAASDTRAVTQTAATTTRR